MKRTRAVAVENTKFGLFCKCDDGDVTSGGVTCIDLSNGVFLQETAANSYIFFASFCLRQQRVFLKSQMARFEIIPHLTVKTNCTASGLPYNPFFRDYDYEMRQRGSSTRSGDRIPGTRKIKKEILARSVPHHWCQGQQSFGVRKVSNVSKNQLNFSTLAINFSWNTFGRFFLNFHQRAGRIVRSESFLDYFLSSNKSNKNE